ncbi:MAG: hypothetical protein ACREQJ_09545 [Candidatus Binatia bacterium]
MKPSVVGIAAVSALWIAFHVAVPLTLLPSRILEGRTRAFGWQIFSALTPLDEYQVVRGDGSLERVALSDHAYLVRVDVPYELGLPTHLCRVTPGARAVLRRIPAAKRMVYHPCP